MKKKANNPIESMDSRKNKEIAWHFFIKLTTSTNVAKEVYPKLAKLKWGKQSFAIPYVNKLAKSWESFFDYGESYAPRRGMSEYKLKIYQLSLRPFFEYLKNNGIELTLEEENFFKFIFESNDLRELLFRKYKDTSFLEAIPTFYMAYCYIPSIKYEANKLKLNLFSNKEIENFQIGNPFFNKNKKYLNDNKNFIIEYLVSCRKLFNFEGLDKKMLKILKLDI